MLDTPAIARGVTRVFSAGRRARRPARTGLEARRAEVRSESEAHRAGVRTEFDAHRAEVRADLAAVEVRLITRTIGIALTAAGVVAAAGTAFAAAVLRTLG